MLICNVPYPVVFQFLIWTPLLTQETCNLFNLGSEGVRIWAMHERAQNVPIYTETSDTIWHLRVKRFKATIGLESLHHPGRANLVALMIQSRDSSRCIIGIWEVNMRLERLDTGWQA